MRRRFLAVAGVFFVLGDAAVYAQTKTPRPSLPPPAAVTRVTISLQSQSVLNALVYLFTQARKPYALADTLVFAGYYEAQELTYPTDQFPAFLIKRNIGGLRASREGRRWVIRAKTAGKPIRIAANANEFSTEIASEFPGQKISYVRRSPAKAVTIRLQNAALEDAIRQVIEASGAPLVCTIENGTFIVHWRS